MICEECGHDCRQAFQLGKLRPFTVFYAPGRELVLCRWCVKRLQAVLPTTQHGQVVWWAQLLGPVAAIALLVASCAGNTPSSAPEFTCRANDGSLCTTFVSGWTADTSNDSCNGISSRWSAELACPAGRVAHCTVSSADLVAVVSSYAPTSLDAAAANCTALGGEFSAP